MENGVILTWSLENIITVTLMALAGYLVFVALSQFLRQGGPKAILQTVQGGG